MKFVTTVVVGVVGAVCGKKHHQHHHHFDGVKVDVSDRATATLTKRVEQKYKRYMESISQNGTVAHVAGIKPLQGGVHDDPSGMVLMIEAKPSPENCEISDKCKTFADETFQWTLDSDGFDDFIKNYKSACKNCEYRVEYTEYFTKNACAAEFPTGASVKIVEFPNPGDLGVIDTTLGLGGAFTDIACTAIPPIRIRVAEAVCSTDPVDLNYYFDFFQWQGSSQAILFVTKPDWNIEETYVANFDGRCTFNDPNAPIKGFLVFDAVVKGTAPTVAAITSAFVAATVLAL